MYSPKFWCVTITALIVLGAAPTIAIADDAGICADESGDVAIAACSRAIASSRYKGSSLAGLYVNRGVEFRNKDDLGRAIADYDQAIRLDPKFAMAYRNRGFAWLAKGDFDRAVADYDRAIQLESKIAGAYFNRGRANLYAGSLPKALADLNQASMLAPKDADFALWLDMVSKRSNLPGRLDQAIAQLDMTTWPAPVIRLYLGRLTSAAVLAAADDADAKTRKGQICQANFHSGELALQQGNKDEAKRLFGLAAADCPRTFVENVAAVAELKALGASP